MLARGAPAALAGVGFLLLLLPSAAAAPPPYPEIQAATTAPRLIPPHGATAFPLYVNWTCSQTEARSLPGDVVRVRFDHASLSRKWVSEVTVNNLSVAAQTGCTRDGFIHRTEAGLLVRDRGGLEPAFTRAVASTFFELLLVRNHQTVSWLGNGYINATFAQDFDPRIEPISEDREPLALELVGLPTTARTRLWVSANAAPEIHLSNVRFAPPTEDVTVHLRKTLRAEWPHHVLLDVQFDFLLGRAQPKPQETVAEFDLEVRHPNSTTRAQQSIVIPLTLPQSLPAEVAPGPAGFLLLTAAMGACLRRAQERRRH